MALARKPACQHIAVRSVIVDDEDCGTLAQTLERVRRIDRLDRAQHVAHDMLLAGAGLWTRIIGAPEFDHGIDLGQQAIGRLLELFKITQESMLWRHILDEHLAIALDGIERVSQIVANAPVEGLERFHILAAGFLDDALDESVELHACAMHALQIGEHVIEGAAAGILDHDVEEIGNRICRRLKLLAQERPHGAAQALIRYGFGRDHRSIVGWVEFFTRPNTLPRERWVSQGATPNLRRSTPFPPDGCRAAAPSCR